MDPGRDVELRDPVEAIVLTTPRRLTILGIDFQADAPSTVFRNFNEQPITADRFYERVREGDIIEAEDQVGSQTVLDEAQEVEFED